LERGAEVRADAQGALPYNPKREPTPAPAILHHAPEPEHLFAYGVATNRVLLLALAYGGYAIGTWAEKIADWGEDAAESLPGLLQAGPWQAIPTPVLVTGFLVAVGLALTALSGVLAIVRFYGFRLEESPAELVARGGLLERVEQALRRDKIRGIRYQQGPLGRLLGVGALHGTQTTSGGMVASAEGPRSKQTFLVPALRPGAFPALAAVLLPGATPPEAEAFHGISPRFRRSLGLRLLPLAAFLGFLFWLLVGLPVPLAVGLPVLTLGGIHLRWRQWGWARGGGLLWVRQGFLGRQVEAFPVGRVQGVVLRDSPVQRRYGLRTLELTFPQGSTTIPFLPEGDAVALANDLLNPAHRVGNRDI
jgi:putative membrane protein